MSFCVYANCANSTRRNPELTFHRFPSNKRVGEKVLNQWLDNCGNPNLFQLDSNSALRNKLICGEHFHKDQYLAENSNRLRIYAVPKPYGNSDLSPRKLTVKTPTKTYSKKRKIIDIEDLPRKTLDVENEELHVITPSTSSTSAVHLQKRRKVEQINIFETPTHTNRFRRIKKDVATIEQLQAKVLQLKKKVVSLKSKNYKLKKYYNNVKKGNTLSSILSAFPFKSHHKRTFVKMQLLHRKKLKWNYSEKQFALSLYYRAPHAYRHLLAQKISLPSVSTIKSWIQSDKFLPGFNKNYLEQLKVRVGFMDEEEKYCVLSFDEMAVKKFLIYNKVLDVIEGFEDLGIFGRRNKVAKEALVFMARGIYSRWKLPVAYFISGNQTVGGILKKVVLKTIEELGSCGLIVRAIVCDQGTNNQTCFKMLGVTRENPYFCHKGHKIYALFDVPHLIKSVRNNLLNGIYILENKIISLNDIETLLKTDSANKAQSLIKISTSHLHPNAFEKLSVKLAAQLFSKKVAAALKTAISTKEVNSQSAPSTAEFIELMDKIFDCLNSNMRFSKNKFKSALSDENSHIKEALLNAVTVFKKLGKAKSQETATKLSRPPCFDGLIQTINGILLIHDEEKQKNKNNYLLTSRFNQDVLENLFSVIRQRGGYCRNPSVQRFRCTFRQVSINSLLRSAETSNCEEDEDYFLSVDSALLKKTQATTSAGPTDLTITTAETESSSSEQEQDIATFPAIVNLEVCSESMFAGYCASTLFKRSKCLTCQSILLNDKAMGWGAQDTLIMYREYEKRATSVGLNAPTELCKLICHCALVIFAKFIDKNIFRQNIRQIMIRKVMSKLQENEEVSLICSDHLKSLLHILFNAKLYSYCKTITRNFASEKKSIKEAKLNIFKHQ